MILVLVIISVFIVVMWGFIWRLDHTQEVVSKNKKCKPTTFDRDGLPLLWECPKQQAIFYKLPIYRLAMTSLVVLFIGYALEISIQDFFIVYRPIYIREQNLNECYSCSNNCNSQYRNSIRSHDTQYNLRFYNSSCTEYNYNTPNNYTTTTPTKTGLNATTILNAVNSHMKTHNATATEKRQPGLTNVSNQYHKFFLQ